MRLKPLINAAKITNSAGFFYFSSGICCVWFRHQLVKFEDHLQVLEVEMAQEKMILTEAQVQAPEK